MTNDEIKFRLLVDRTFRLQMIEQADFPRWQKVASKYESIGRTERRRLAGKYKP